MLAEVQSVFLTLETVVEKTISTSALRPTWTRGAQSAQKNMEIGTTTTPSQVGKLHFSSRTAINGPWGEIVFSIAVCKVKNEF